MEVVLVDVALVAAATGVDWGDDDDDDVHTAGEQRPAPPLGEAADKKQNTGQRLAAEEEEARRQHTAVSVGMPAGELDRRIAHTGPLDRRSHPTWDPL